MTTRNSDLLAIVLVTLWAIVPAAQAEDCNFNGIDDLLELEGNDCNGNLIPDSCEVTDVDRLFVSAIEYDVGNPWAVALGDFNSDGHLDVVAGNHSSPGSVSVLLNNGDGTFGEAVDYPTGDFADVVAVGDFNGDTFLDLVVGHEDGTSVLLGTINGTFAPEVRYGSATSYDSIAVGDMNNDTFLDLVTDNGPAFAVRYGNGDGTFGSPVSYLAANTLRYIAIADLNNDGNLDLIGVNDDVMTVLMGNGDGTFGPQMNYEPGGHTVAVGDLDNDGDLDLVTTFSMGAFDASTLVWLNNGAGVFGEFTVVQEDVYWAAASIVDVNADGNLDLCIVTPSSGSLHLSLLLGNGDGTFAPEMRYQASAQSAVSAGDLDGNGFDDLVVPGSTVTILFSSGDGTLEAPVMFNSSFSRVAAGDLNSDGAVDVALIDEGADTVTVRLGNGDGNFPFVSDIQSVPAGNSVAVRMAHLNGDDHLDVVVADTDIHVLLGNGDGTLMPRVEYFTGTGGIDSFTIGDLDNDGDLDFVGADESDDEIAVLLGNGDGTFGLPGLFPAGDHPESPVLGDVDNDGILDLAVANGPEDVVSLLLGNGDGTFEAPLSYGVGNNPSVVAFGDFNADGDLDLAVTNCDSSDLSVLLGNGDGTFGVEVRFDSAGCVSPQILVATDITGDGHVDLILGGMSVLVGNGDGTFAPDALDFGLYATSFVLADVDNDGDADVITNRSVLFHRDGDCNANGVFDGCDIAEGTSTDCGGNGIPDECDPDCNANGIPDDCDINAGTSADCNANGYPDECDPDCNANGVADSCDVDTGTSNDCDGNGVPDECELDCNANGLVDGCDLAGGTSEDCNGNNVPDECDVASGASGDCNENNVPDECDIFELTAQDCNLNGIPDDCDIASGTSQDVNGDGAPDECFICGDAKVSTPFGAIDDRFGWSVAIDNGVAVVGASDGSGLEDASGTAYIYRFDGTDWVMEAELFASDGATDDRFGNAVAIDNNVVVIAAWKNDDNGENSGSAYVFRFDGTNWIEEAKLLASDAASFDSFGGAVTIHDDAVIVGAHGNDPGGAAYIFRFDGATWAEEALLRASDDESGDFFGGKVAIGSDVAVVGAFKNDTASGHHAGSAYVFRFDGTTWLEETNLLASDSVAEDHFGQAVALDENVTVVGSNHGNGTAYVFRFDGFGWTEEAQLSAADGELSNEFSRSVAIGGDVVVVGAPWSADRAGAAYLYHFDGDQWMEETKLTPADGVVDDHFGRSVAMSGDTFIVGSVRDPDTSQDSGSAYIYTVCPDLCQGDAENASVHNLTQGTDYPLVQCALDAAADGDVIEVDPGVYVENIDFLDKDITLRSTDPFDLDVVESTLIDGGGQDTVVTLSAGTLSGFTITGGANTGLDAGGVHASGTAVVSHNVITGNSANEKGGGVTAKDTVVIRNNRIVFNFGGNRAGGVNARNDALIIDNYIAFNEAISGGGGIRARENSVIRNNTIVFNSSADTGGGVLGGGGILAEDSSVLTNNIVAFSTDGAGIHAKVGESVTADYNCVFGNFDGEYSGDAVAGANDVNVDPELDDDDLHLLSSSPCIDAGDEALEPLFDETDIDAESRIQNDRVDIGADETPPSSCDGDANGDGTVDPLDGGFVLARFGCPVGTGDPLCDAADQNGDGAVDPLDSGYVLARFGECS